MRRRSRQVSPSVSAAQSSCRQTSPRQMTVPLPAVASPTNTCPSAETTRHSLEASSKRISSAKDRVSPLPKKTRAHSALPISRSASPGALPRILSSGARSPYIRTRVRKRERREILLGAAARKTAGSASVTASQTIPSEGSKSNGRSTGTLRRYSSTCVAQYSPPSLPVYRMRYSTLPAISALPAPTYLSVGRAVARTRKSRLISG